MAWDRLLCLTQDDTLHLLFWVSRHAKGVYICEACGTDEALRDWTGNVKPLSDWVLVRVYNGDLWKEAK